MVEAGAEDQPEEVVREEGGEEHQVRGHGIVSQIQGINLKDIQICPLFMHARNTGPGEKVLIGVRNPILVPGGNLLHLNLHKNETVTSLTMN